MVTSELKGVKHYFLKGEWFFKRKILVNPKEKMGCDTGEWTTEKYAWTRGTYTKISGSGECYKYEETVLDMCELYEKQKELRKIRDSRELSLAITNMQQVISWMEIVLLQYSPPGIE